MSTASSRKRTRTVRSDSSRSSKRRRSVHRDDDDAFSGIGVELDAPVAATLDSLVPTSALSAEAPPRQTGSSASGSSKPRRATSSKATRPSDAAAAAAALRRLPATMLERQAARDLQASPVLSILSNPRMMEPILRFLTPVEVRALLVAAGPRENVDFVYEALCRRYVEPDELWQIASNFRQKIREAAKNSQTDLVKEEGSSDEDDVDEESMAERPHSAIHRSRNSAAEPSKFEPHLFRELYFRKIHPKFCEECAGTVEERQDFFPDEEQDANDAIVTFCDTCRGKFLRSDIVREKLLSIQRGWATLYRLSEIEEPFASPLRHAGLYVLSAEWTAIVSSFGAASRAFVARGREAFAKNLFEDCGLGFCKKFLPRVYPPTVEKLLKTPRRNALARCTLARTVEAYREWSSTTDPDDFLRLSTFINNCLHEYRRVQTHKRAALAMLVVAEFLFCRWHDERAVFLNYVPLMHTLLHNDDGSAYYFMGHYFDRRRIEELFAEYVHGIRQDDIFVKTSDLIRESRQAAARAPDQHGFRKTALEGDALLAKFASGTRTEEQIKKDSVLAKLRGMLAPGG